MAIVSDQMFETPNGRGAMTLDNLTVSAGAAQGTLVGNILNVPPGVTPGVRTGDGFAIAGNAITGWQVVVATPNTISQPATLHLFAGIQVVRLPIATLGSGGGGSVLRQVTSGTSVPTGIASISGNMVTYQSRHVVNEDTPFLQMVTPMFYQNGASSPYVETVMTPAAGTMFMADAQMVSTFDGRTFTTNVPQQTVGGVQSPTNPTPNFLANKALQWDQIPASTFGLTTFKKGDVVAFKLAIVFPSTGQTWIACAASGESSIRTGGSGGYEDCRIGTYPTNNVIGTAGGLSGTSGTSTINRYVRPILVLGQHNNRAVIGYGDSITDGKGSNRAGDGSTTNTIGGWFVGAAYAAGVAHTKCGVDGNRASYMTSTNATARIAMAQYFTHAMIALGTNDINGVSDQGAQFLSDLAAFRSLLKGSNSAIKIYANLVPLRVSSSTDNYATLANQTVQSGYASTTGTARATSNATLTAAIGQSGSNLNGVFNYSSGMQDASDPDRWATNGTAGAPTVDGTHPSLAIVNGTLGSGMINAVQPVISGLN